MIDEVTRLTILKFRPRYDVYDPIHSSVLVLVLGRFSIQHTNIALPQKSLHSFWITSLIKSLVDSLLMYLSKKLIEPAGPLCTWGSDSTNDLFKKTYFQSILSNNNSEHPINDPSSNRTFEALLSSPAVSSFFTTLKAFLSNSKWCFL